MFFQATYVGKQFCLFLPENIVKIEVVVEKFVLVCFALNNWHSLMTIVVDVLVDLKYLASDIVDFLEVVLDVVDGDELQHTQGDQFLLEITVEVEFAKVYLDLELTLVEVYGSWTVAYFLLVEEKQ